MRVHPAGEQNSWFLLMHHNATVAHHVFQHHIVGWPVVCSRSLFATSLCSSLPFHSPMAAMRIRCCSSCTSCAAAVVCGAACVCCRMSQGSRWWTACLVSSCTQHSSVRRLESRTRCVLTQGAASKQPHQPPGQPRQLQLAQLQDGQQQPCTASTYETLQKIHTAAAPYAIPA